MPEVSGDGEAKVQWGIVLTILIGVFMGAMDSSLVSPARKVIEGALGVDASSGVWMITMYTLVYAVSMPIVGKLSDIVGRSRVFTLSVQLFAFGALIAGLSQRIGGFPLLLVGRAVQALGGGGIMPIAAAEIGTLFPPEKRGAALGIMGATFGIASILGPTIGSGILDAFGQQNWGWLFFLQVPLAFAPFIPGMGLKTNVKALERKPLDLKGAGLITLSLLSLMYGLTNFKLNHLETFTQTNVWPFMAFALVLIPLIAWVERRSEDPVIDLSLFANKEIVLALIVSVFTGICLMGVIFVPQWGENLLRIASGKGGYIVTAMAVFSGVAAPLGGRFVDKWGAKWVIVGGFACTITGTLLMANWVVSLWQIFVALAFVGLGIGFTMGTPLNYLVLVLVPERKAGSALAVLSLFRSIGTTMAPSLMAGYLVEAGRNLMPALQASVPAFKSMPATTSGGAAAKGMELLQTADVTNIVDRLQDFIKSMPGIPPFVKPMIYTQIKASSAQIQDVYQSVINAGFHNIYTTTAIIAGVGLVITMAMASRPADVEERGAVSKAGAAAGDGA